MNATVVIAILLAQLFLAIWIWNRESFWATIFACSIAILSYAFWDEPFKAELAKVLPNVYEIGRVGGATILAQIIAHAIGWFVAWGIKGVPD